MSIKDLLRKRTYLTVTQGPIQREEKEEKVEKPIIPNGMWNKCSKCGTVYYKEDVEKNLWVCTNCNHHFRIGGRKRIDLVIDENTFTEIFGDFTSVDPLSFNGYDEKISKAEESSKEKEAVITGFGEINGLKVALGVMNSEFMMGSMGTVVGEKLTRLIEEATEKSLPVIIFTTSGGARMQEGIFSLMQMAKVSAALERHDKKGLLYITVLTDPTTGGVTASFAMEGDIILSEPGALIGFAGRRVIEGTIKQKLPDDFQTAEFLLEKGFIDSIVHRTNMKDSIYRLLTLHGVKRDE